MRDSAITETVEMYQNEQDQQAYCIQQDSKPIQILAQETVDAKSVQILAEEVDASTIEAQQNSSDPTTSNKNGIKYVGSMNSLNKQSSNSNKSSQQNMDENLYAVVDELDENATSSDASRIASEVASAQPSSQRMQKQLSEFYDEGTLGTEYQKVIITNYPMATDE